MSLSMSIVFNVSLSITPPIFVAPLNTFATWHMSTLLHFSFFDFFNSPFYTDFLKSPVGKHARKQTFCVPFVLPSFFPLFLPSIVASLHLFLSFSLSMIPFGQRLRRLGQMRGSSGSDAIRGGREYCEASSGDATETKRTQDTEVLRKKNRGMECSLPRAVVTHRRPKKRLSSLTSDLREWQHFEKWSTNELKKC